MGPGVNDANFRSIKGDPNLLQQENILAQNLRENKKQAKKSQTRFSAPSQSPTREPAIVYKIFFQQVGTALA